MPVIAVINRKGGSGKSTLATHLAAYCALTGKRVMLGDVDRQQSAQTWLKLRGAQKLPAQSAIQGWTLDPKNVLRAPAGVTHVILDTPGGMRGFELARIVMSADAILMPVCNSVFDRESAAECFAELKSLPRVATGRCKVGAIGMRLDARTRADEVLAAWALKLDLPFIGVLREAQSYVRCIENGLTLFDLPKNHAQADLAQWKPIFKWLEEALRVAEPAAAAKAQAAAQSEAATKPLPSQILASTLAKAAPVQPASEHSAPVQPASAHSAVAHSASAHATSVHSALPPATLSKPVREPAAQARPPTLRQVERAPLGELVHAGTLASIGELARTLKAAEANDSVRPGTQADAAAVPLRPTRPIIPPSARPGATTSSSDAAAQNASSSVGAGQRTAASDAAPAARPRPLSPTPGTPLARPAPGAAGSSPMKTDGVRPRSSATTQAGPARPAVATRLTQLLDTLPIPRFLQRNS